MLCLYNFPASSNYFLILFILLITNSGLNKNSCVNTVQYVYKVRNNVINFAASFVPRPIPINCLHLLQLHAAMSLLGGSSI